MSDNQENNNNENNNNQNNNNQKSNVAGIVTVLVVLFVIIAIFIFLFAKLINFVESIIFSDDFKDMANNAVQQIQQIEQKTYDSQLESLTEELVGVLEDEDTYVQYDIYNGAITIDIFRQDLTVPEEELDATRFGIELFGEVPDTLFNEVIAWYHSRGEYPYVVINMCDSQGHILYKVEGDTQVEVNY